MAYQNRLYRAQTMSRKQFSHPTNVHITGNVIVGRIFVGGNLTVDGDLVAEEIFCMGKLTVGGKFSASMA